LYTLSSSEQKIFSIDSYIRNQYYYSFTPLPYYHKPFGRLNYAARYLDLFRLQNLQEGIAKDISKRDYDVAFINPCQYTQAPAILNYLKIPSLYYCTEPLRVAYEPKIPRPYSSRSNLKSVIDKIDIIQKLYKNKRKKIEQTAARSASRMVVNSYYTRETTYRLYGKDSRVIYPSVDIDLFKPLGILKKDIVFSVGALTPLKGFDFVIRSLYMIPETHRPSLVIASNYQENEEKIYLEGLSQETGVNVNFLTGIKDELLIEFYNAAQVTICASVLEPFGMTPLESMSCGTPVVSVAEGGLRESIIHGQTGFYVDRDASQCADAISQLLANPQKAACIGQNGRDHVIKNWTLRNSVPKLEKCLNECADLKW
jgi:glycosyltransferase involved in cell wall biosynthesis